MIETVRIEQWLYNTLTTDSVLNSLVGDRVYAYQAPQEATFPLIVFARMSGRDVRVVGPARVLANELYEVKAIGRGTTIGFAALKAIADRIDVLLDGASGAVADGQILACVRENALSYAETDADQIYCHLGGLYRIYVKAI